jgi:hypothetical protein
LEEALLDALLENLLSRRADVLVPMTTPSPADASSSGLAGFEIVDPTSPWADSAVRMLAELEFRAFEETLPADTPKPDATGRLFKADHAVYPHPAEAGGLPGGWHIRWSATYVGNPDSTSEAFIVERANGGWTMVFHLVPSRRPLTPKTNLWELAAVTMEGLYALALKETVDKAGRPVSPVAEHTLRDYILTRYDLTDPVEEAEATLVGLGARITVFPRALG